MESQSPLYSQGFNNCGKSHSSQSREQPAISLEVHPPGYHHRPAERSPPQPPNLLNDIAPIPLHQAIWTSNNITPLTGETTFTRHGNSIARDSFASPYHPSPFASAARPSQPVLAFHHSPPTADFYQRNFEYDLGSHSCENGFNLIHSSPEFSPRASPLVQTLPPTPPPMPSFEDDELVLIPPIDIKLNDVLCGRGAGANTHPGNIKFRTLIADYHALYLHSKPLSKANVAKKVVVEITSNGGRFLRRSTQTCPLDKTHFWYDIGFKAAREKTCQALRERAVSCFDIREAPFARSQNWGGASEDSGNFACEEIEVNDEDVLLGRGGLTNSHPGNQMFRELVRQRQMEYMATPKQKKAEVVKRVIDQIFTRGGRFLLDKKGRWVEISRAKARAKTSQAFREKASTAKLKADEVLELLEIKSGDELDDQALRI